LRALVLSLAVIVTVAAAAGPSAAADSPWNGTWEADYSKSKLTGETFTYSSLPGGMMRYTNGSTYVDTFACNGKPHLTPAGSMQTCTKGGPDSYSFTYTVNGKTIETDMDTISTDGNSLANIEHDVLPGGKMRTLTSVSTRVGAGTGLAGTWKTAKTTHSSRYTFALAATPTTLTYRSKTGGENYTLKFGGPSVPDSGFDIPKNISVSGKAAGPSEIALTYSIAGKAVYEATWILSNDGKTLTATNWAPGKKNEAVVEIFEKQ
jgi:hypothetical protein